MLGIKIKEELKEQGIDPNSEEGIRIYNQRMGSSEIAHDTIWIKLVKKEENVDGTVKQVIQIVKDPKIVQQYRKKLKKPSLGRAQKKLTAPHTLREEAEQANVKRQKRKLQEKLRRLKRQLQMAKSQEAKNANTLRTLIRVRRTRRKRSRRLERVFYLPHQHLYGVWELKMARHDQ